MLILTATIIITPIPNMAASVAFQVSGTYQLSESTWTDTLIYEDDQGSPTPISSSPIPLNSSSWSFTHPALPPGTHTVSIKDPLTGSVQTSNQFTVGVAQVITANAPTGAVAGTAFTFTGSLLNFTTAPTLTYSLNDGPPVALSGVTNTGWTTQLTIATAGSYTIIVSSGAISSNTVSFTVAPATVNNTITINPLNNGASISAGQSISFIGSLGGYANPPSLTYTINNGPQQTVTGVTATGWNMTITAPATAGTYVINVSDGTTQTSLNFSVGPAAKVITPSASSGAVAGQSFTFQGSISGYTTIPALSYALNGGTAVPMTGVSLSGWAMTVTIPTAGNYTIVVSDGAGTSGSTTFAVSQQTTALRNWYQNPGMDGSFWVQPFYSSAQWITSGSLITALRNGSHGSPTGSVNLKDNYATPYVYGTESDPIVTVTDGTNTIHVHMPAGTIIETPNSAVDNSIGGTDATQPYLVWSISGATMSPSPSVAGSVITGTYGMAVMDGSGLMMVDSVTGQPGDGNAVGGIMDYELSLLNADPNFVIPHMLAFQLDQSTQCSGQGPVWPLKLVDLSGPNTGPIPQGITIGIPASVKRPVGQTRGFYAWFDQLQQYGAFEYNDGATGSVNFTIYSTNSANATLVTDMVNSISAVMAYVCILNYTLDGVNTPLGTNLSGAQYSLATTKGFVPGATPAFPPPPPLDLSPTGGVNVAPSTFGAWYPSGYNAIPTNSTTTPTFTISPNAPSNAVVNTPFTFSGSLGGYANAPALTYSLDGGPATTLGGVTSTGWSTQLTISSTTPTPTPTSQAPQQAQAAGFTQLVLNEDFSSNGAIANGAGTVASFYMQTPYGQESTTSDWSISNSVLTLNPASGGFNLQLASSPANSGYVTSTSGNPQFNTGNGIAYQYGYFEASVKWSETPGSGSPAWWMFDPIGVASPNTRHTEIDILEAQNINGSVQPASTLWDWNNGSGSNQAQKIGGSSCTDSRPANFVSGGFNTYGVLWTPTQITFYINGQIAVQPGGQNPITVGSGSAFPTTGDPEFLALGTGTRNPMSVDWVNVWQAPVNATPTPTPTPTGTPAVGPHTITVTDALHSISATVNFTVSSGSSSSTPVTWNSSDLAGSISLSADKYTATATGSSTPNSAPGGVRATTAINATKIVLFEIALSEITQNCAVGVANSAAVLNSTGGLGVDTNSLGFYCSTGTGSQPAQTAYENSAQLTSGNGVTSVAGEVVTIVTNGSLGFFSDSAMRSTSGVSFNNSATANPITGAGGFSFSSVGATYFPAFATGEGGGVAILNDGTKPLSAFATAFLAANPSVVTLSGQVTQAGKTISPATPVGVVAGQSFSFTGAISGYKIVPSLTYTVSGGVATPLPGVTLTGWATTITIPATGTYTITVSDGTVNGETGGFVVSASAGSTPTVSVSLTATTGQTVANTVYGFGTGTFANNGFANTGVPALASAFQSLQPSLFRVNMNATVSGQVWQDAVFATGGPFWQYFDPIIVNAGSGGASAVVAPLTGSVTTGTWVVNQRFSLAGSPSGLGYMQFNYILPAQYNPSLVYPIMFVGHPNDSGMNGSSYPKDGGTFVTNTSFNGFSLDSMFNTVTFRTAHPCIVVACQCDQTLDLSGANGNANFGGYNDSQNSGWNENAVSGILEAFISGSIVPGLQIDPGKRYHIGYSLGGIGTLAYLVDNNQYNGPGLRLWSAGATYSDQLFRPATPNSSVFSRMSTVPLLTISQTTDNDPTSYDEPAWTAYTGNTNYPTKSNYDSGGMAAVRAGTTQYYYINNGSSNTASTFMPMNADGGDGDKIYAWLFSINSGSSSGYLASNTQIVLGIGSANTSISATDLANRATLMAQRAITLGRPINLYELWNEPGPNGPIAESTYCTWYNSVQSALKAVSSSYKLFGPVTSSVTSTAPDPWLQTFAAQCPTADGICFHTFSYAPGQQPSTAAGVYALTQIPTEVSVAAATLAGTALAGKPIMLGEYNLNSADTGNDPWQTTITDAVWIANSLYQAINLNVNLQYGAVWEALFDGTYGVIQGTSSAPTITPSGYYLGHAGQIMGGSRVTVNSANLANVATWATVSGNNFALELVNPTTSAFPGTLVTINPGGTNNINFWQISSSALIPSTSVIASSSLSSAGITLPAQSVTHLTGTFSPTASGVFSIDAVNGRVIGPNGNPFVGRGTAIRSNDLTTYVTNAACQPLTTMFPGINMVRLSAYSYFTPTQYAQQIQWLTAQHIVVVIEDHMSSTGSTGGGGQGVVFTGTQLQNELNWYAALATQFLGNPYVWFGTNNEPPNNPSLAALYTWQIQTVNAIRGTGSNTIVELEQYNPYLQGALGGVPQNTFQGLHNIVFGPHYYSWIWGGQGTSVSQATIYSSTPGLANSQYGGIVQQVANIQWFPSADGPRVPVGCFEFGPSTDGTNYDASGNADVDAVFQAVNSGTLFCSLAWIINDSASDNLGTASGLTTYGKAVASQIATQTGSL